MNDATRSLQELGLTEKETAIYVSLLEGGPAIVQDIARKADVNRTTVYGTLQGLQSRGLVSNVERDGKVIYQAESPVQLRRMIEVERDRLEMRAASLEELLPSLQAFFRMTDDKPLVRYFEGEEGLRVCREAMCELAGEGQSYCQFVAVDEALLAASRCGQDMRRRMTSGKFSVRALCTIAPGLAPPVAGPNLELRYVSEGALPFQGELDIFETFILVASYKHRPLAVLIESIELAQLLRALFEMAWNTGNKNAP